MSDKVISITNQNSIVEARDEDDGMIRFVHGMTIGSIEDLNEEQYSIIVELMKGYSDFVAEDMV